MKRRHFALALLAATLAASAIAPAQAQGPVRIVVGFSPGGSADTIARLVAEQMQRSLGRTVIVENRTGAAGRLAPEQVKQAAPDGDTLVIVPHGPMALFPHVYKNLRYDPVKDFTPIARLISFDYALFAAPAVSARNADELKRFIAAAKGNASYGSPGAGSVPHFVGVSIAQALGAPMVHVPYRGGAPALTDVAGGVLPFAIVTPADGAPLVAAGKLKVLATSGDKRSPFFDRVPTFREFGIGVDVTGWFALYGPAGMPQATVDALQRAATSAVQADALRARWHELGLRADPSTPAALAQLQQRESAHWAKIVPTSGFTPED